MHLFTPTLGFLLMIPLIANSAIVRVSNKGKDSFNCVNGSSTPCKTLRYVITKLTNMSNLEIQLESKIQLQHVIQFEDMVNLSINGSHAPQITINCSHNSALHFKNVKNVTILNITMKSCGAPGLGYKVALLFISSVNITILSSTIERSEYTGIVFHACSGKNLLLGVDLLHNGYACNHTNNYTSLFPAGVSFEITNPDEVSYKLTSCNIKYNIGGCEEKRISTNIPGSDIYWKGHGIGGGIGVYFNKNCSNNTLTILDTVVCNNYGKWGGGMYIQFQDRTQNNSVVVKNSTFCENNASSAGGGVNIVFINERSQINHTNQVNFSAVQLVGNHSPRYGGGVAITSTPSYTKYEPGGNVIFDNCTLKNNTAHYSAAVDISPYYYNHTVHDGFLPIPLFTNVEVIGNSIQQGKSLKTKIEVTTGVFSITKFTAHFNGSINFTENKFSALLLSSAVAVFDSGTNSHFYSNSAGGFNGGGIAMYGFSIISVSVHTLFKFINNTAGQYGGAIYYQTSDQLTFITGTSCFIQFNNSCQNLPIEHRNITFIFKGNRANSGANSIYADSFYSCLFKCSNRRYYVTKDILQCIGNVTIDDDNTTLQSSSKYFRFGTNFKGERKAIPGAKLKIPFTVLDEFNQTIKPLMNLGVSANSSQFLVSPEFTLGNEIIPQGFPDSTATLHFITQGIGGIFFLFNVTLSDCPPGFYFNKNLLKCTCSVDPDTEQSTNLYSAVKYCHMNTYQAKMKRDYWAGYINPTSGSYQHLHLYFAPCFQPLCNGSTLLPNSSNSLESSICVENRIDIMCGKCATGYSVYYHSHGFQCKANHKLCKLGPFLYLISEILPVCIIFIVIVIFDFSFTSGKTVGFIFFCQYLDKLVVHLDDTISYTRKPYRIFYGIFNFDYFPLSPFCLWKDMQILDVIAFKYLTILFAFLLVVALLSLLKNNRCIWLQKLRTRITTKRSFVRGLSAFLVICYSQCTNTSFLILKFTVPIGFNGTMTHRYSYYGGLPYLRDRHLFYAIPAIFCLIFVTILPPLILLLHPLILHFLSLCGLSEHWLVTKMLKLIAIDKLIPFLDCFQSCYKDKLRFFAGLHFVYRVVILCTYTLFETYYGYRVSSEVSLILFLGVHACVQPYKKRLHNLIDSLVYLNLALINACSIYSDYLLEDLVETKNKTHYEKNVPLMALTVIQLILLYLPMLVFLIYAGVKVKLFCRRHIGRKSYKMLVEVDQEVAT